MAAVEMHLKVYHAAYEMNASSWRPATMYGLNSELDRSHWFDLVKQVKQGQAVTTDKRGTVVHVQDVADALKPFHNEHRVHATACRTGATVVRTQAVGAGVYTAVWHPS